MARKKALVIGVPVALVVTLYILLVTLWGVPAVTIVNDSGDNIGFMNCKDWREFESGETLELRPNGPCSVYRLEGSFQTYLDCLFFPEETFVSDAEVRVSSLDGTVSQPDCADGESYDHYAPASKAIKKVIDWVTP